MTAKLANCLQAARAPRVPSLLVLLALLTACGTTFQVPLSPVLDAPPLPPRLPIEVGVFYDDDFKTYEAVEPVSLHAENRFVRSLGAASVRMFDEAIAALFEKTTRLAARPAFGDTPPNVRGVIEPTIEAASFGPVNRGMGWGSSVWAEVTYGIRLYSPRGELIGAWRVTGFGEADTHAFHELEVLGLATDRSIEDALRKFLAGFFDVPEVRRWLRKTG